MLKQVFTTNRNSDKNNRPRSNSSKTKLPLLPVDQAIQHAKMQTASQSGGGGGGTTEESGVNSDMSRTPSSHSGRRSPLVHSNSPMPSPTASAGSRPSTPHRSPQAEKEQPQQLEAPQGAPHSAVLDYSTEWQHEQQQLNYIDYRDGVLCKNARPFARVAHCFVCDVGVDPDNDASSPPQVLVASVEATGTKSHQGRQDVTVYRQLFRCRQCVAAQQQQLAGGQPQPIRISRDTHQMYFMRNG